MCFVDKNIRQNGWEDKVRYVLTVHDEVVYEIVPELLMEAVRKLDEWMTIPWKLPKAHGRDWVVPLLTEPGIDINWKARFDYFKCVDGIPADPKNIDENNKYTGKLKKDEYFLDGRIYQKIPDFLKDHLRRNGEAPPDTFPEKTPEPVVKSESAIPAEPQEFGLDESLPESVTPKIREKTPSEPPKKPAETPKASVPQPSHEAVPDIKESQKDVFRWTLRAALNKRNLKKLHAICILAEGESPLRVVTPEGKVLVNESDAPSINISEFEVLTKLFGLN
jgi:hypothetical protein